jgi:ribonuclease P protein component
MSDAGAPRRPLTFPRARRLTRSAEFLRVKTEGVSQRGSLLVVGALRTGTEGECRTGIVTSRRVGGAVVRNRIRRRLREVVRQHPEALKRGFWLVVIARPAAARASYRALEHEWLRLTRRVLS